MVGEVKVFHSESQALQQAQAGTIEEARHDPVHALERTEQRSDLRSGQHNRQTLRTLGADHLLQPAEVQAEHVAVQKDQRTERLILRRGAYLSVHCQFREKLRDLVRTHLLGMALPVEQDKPLNPTDIRLFRPYAIVPQPDRFPDPVEQFRLVPFGSTSLFGKTLE
jgi:hypothetical protein